MTQRKGRLEQQQNAESATAGHTPSGAPESPRSPTGCPVSAGAARFDSFGSEYQLDPAEALRWARAEEPVFYSPKLGYWVVARYDDVKTVFRDNTTFSPRIALESMAEPAPEAAKILARYKYGMNRTLVNEEEPLHMERRRVLQTTFLPENLATFEPMVRRLTREYMDRFIDRGQADLVEEMLWEIPLTVALHFLGVAEEDMETLREYSIAHTLNTWGKPTAERQLAVAETVGQFWQYAGQILDKMRRDPSGPGWMKHAVRCQLEMPELISDSFLQSNMMAGIVAAHETTANASANAFRVLLEERHIWDSMCADPSLIPNAVEECLRHSGSVAAWRRLVVKDTELGGVSIPAGAKLLVVMASANHDERHFDHPDDLDIYRENTTDHLTFGYGSHQCLGKNLARMQMRIYLEEFTRRLPHLELVPNQTFAYLPSFAFRGPDHLYVQWNPALNPERRDPAILDKQAAFAIGAPPKSALARQLLVAEAVAETPDVLRLVLKDSGADPLPAWTAGAHIDIDLGDYVRSYSLCGDPSETDSMVIAVLKEENGRGGSDFIHRHVRAGTLLKVRGPKNNFRLDESAERYVLVAGGIGITPIISMADRLKQLGKEYELHYCGRSLASLAFLARARRDHGDNLRLYAGADGDRLDVNALVAGIADDAEVYACGPSRLLEALEQRMADHADRLHVEFFSSAAHRLDPDQEMPFDVELRDSQLSLTIPPAKTLLEVLRAAGIDVPSDCEEGLCGSCEVTVIEGKIDHRDRVLTAGEREQGSRMMACCSRGKGKLTLSL